MESFHALLHGSRAPICWLCGQAVCSHLSSNPRNVYFEADEMPERLYTVLTRVQHKGRILYQPGQQIPLGEAVRLDLPGAKQLAVNPAPVQRKPMHSAEDRAEHSGADR